MNLRLCLILFLDDRAGQRSIAYTTSASAVQEALNTRKCGVSGALRTRVSVCWPAFNVPT